jgi:hypothetical protein
MYNNDDNYKYFEPLSNYDLSRVMIEEMKERANIVNTTDMRQYKTFEDLWKGKGHCILFENPDKQTVGHWTALIRQKASKSNNNKETCIYIDSYGDKLNIPRVKELLKQKYDVIQYNPKRLQEYNTNLCGVYALICVILNKIVPNLDIKKILKFFHSKENDQNFDQFVHDIAQDL